MDTFPAMATLESHSTCIHVYVCVPQHTTRLVPTAQPERQAHGSSGPEPPLLLLPVHSPNEVGPAFGGASETTLLSSFLSLSLSKRRAELTKIA